VRAVVEKTLPVLTGLLGKDSEEVRRRTFRRDVVRHRHR
jgi:hypothetical protein